MKTLYSIFGFCGLLWATFSFMLVVTLFTTLYAILFLFTGKKYVRLCIWITCRYLSNFLLGIWLIRTSIHGRERVDPKGTYVFVANHLTQLDTVVVGSSVPHAVSFLAKKEVNRIPVFGFMVKMLAIMVDRKSKESREKSVRYMTNELAKGYSIFIFPEGTRNRTDQPLAPFKEGAFRLAIAAQVPIVVQTLVGTKKLNDPRGLQLYPGHADIFFSHPVETTGLTAEDLPFVVEKVKQEMLSHLT